MFRLLPESPQDADEVETLYDLAFAPGRAALSAYTLRRGVAPVAALSRIARDDYDTLIAAIRYWPVAIGPARRPALLLGPVAVHPTRQGEGLGALLIGDTLDRARTLGWRRVVLVGDAPYYGRFGFTREAALGLDFPAPVNPERCLARALVPGAMTGVAGAVLPWSAADGPAE